MTPYLKLFRIFEVFSVKTPKQTSSSSSMLIRGRRSTRVPGYSSSFIITRLDNSVTATR